MPIDWDGTIFSALAMYAKSLENMTEAFRVSSMPKDDWLTVTVDYHS